jgi:uncharacterized membrane protein YphA (DoxX/SURF4 family)
MFIVTAVVSVLLAAALIGSGSGKLAGVKNVLDAMTTVRFPLDKLWVLAGLEFAGAAGLVIGLFWWPLGVAAAIGVVLYFLAAVGSHLRVRDLQGVAPSAVLLVVAIAALVLRLATR